MAKDVELLQDVFVALEDAMVLYAPEFTTPEQKKEVSGRIYENGGTLYYFARLRERLNKVIDKDAQLKQLQSDLEYSAFNLCDIKIEDLEEGIIESTCPETTLLIAIRNLKAMIGDE